MAEIIWQELWGPVATTLLLATVSTAILLTLVLPLAWWLARTPSRLAPWVEACAALPLVLPPTVIGFYLLLAFAPDGPIGSLTQSLGMASLAFTFEGLVIGSILYSLPFALQPLQAAFAAIPQAPLEAAATLGAGRLDRFFSVALPLARRGLIAAVVLAFAHTIGEFGIVLMIGGNIPGETRVLSVAIYDHVEQLRTLEAHLLSGGTLVMSFMLLLAVYGVLRPRSNH